VFYCINPVFGYKTLTEFFLFFSLEGKPSRTAPTGSSNAERKARKFGTS